MIGRSKYNRENYPRKAFEHKKEKRGLNWLSANRPSNNWAQRFFSLSFCVVHALHGVFYTLTEQLYFFAALSITFRGYEAGLFHTY